MRTEYAVVRPTRRKCFFFQYNIQFYYIILYMLETAQIETRSLNILLTRRTII